MCVDHRLTVTLMWNTKKQAQSQIDTNPHYQCYYYQHETVNNLFLQGIIVKADLCTLGTHHACFLQFIICRS